LASAPVSVARQGISALDKPQTFREQRASAPERFVLVSRFVLIAPLVWMLRIIKEGTVNERDRWCTPVNTGMTGQEGRTPVWKQGSQSFYRRYTLINSWSTLDLSWKCP